MLKNVLAAVGLAVITQVGFRLFIRYSVMKEENRRWHTVHRDNCRRARNPGTETPTE
jgi:hypothetical protein